MIARFDHNFLQLSEFPRSNRNQILKIRIPVVPARGIVNQPCLNMDANLFLPLQKSESYYFVIYVSAKCKKAD